MSVQSEGLRVVWLPVNQAWQVMYGDSVTGIGDANRSLFSDLDDLRDELRLVGLELVETNIKLRDSLEKAEAERDSFQETANFWCDRAQEAQAERDAALARAEKAEAEVERLRTQLADLEQALSITKAELRLAREARSDEWKRAEDAEARVAKLKGARCRFDETWKCHD